MELIVFSLRCLELLFPLLLFLSVRLHQLMVLFAPVSVDGFDLILVLLTDEVLPVRKLVDCSLQVSNLLQVHPVLSIKF